MSISMNGMVINMRRKKLFNRIMSAVAVIGVTVGILGLASHVDAANLEKTRGRINVDLEDFKLVESTISDTGRFGLEATNDAKSQYKLHFKNSFTDRNNIGCTYRSTSKFDLTDVTHIQFYAYALQDEEDNKFMIYVDPKSNTYYHRKDRDDLTNNLVSGSGGIWKQSSLCYSSYGKTPQDYQNSINARYSSEYVFVGISHQWFVHDAQIFLDNKTVTSTTSGCINLKLKSHGITLIEPEQPKRVNADGSMTTYTAFGNLEMGLATGEYAPGEKGNIYRDEKIVLKYTLAGDADAPAAKLTQFKFYSDKEKKNLLYTMDVSGSDRQCEIVFNSDLIKKIENYNPGTLGAIYLEPVFETQDVTVEFSLNVPEAKNEVEVVKNSNIKYTLREKASQKTIGTFALNGARKVGDTFTVKYTPNSNYDGDYEFSYYNYRVCESSNQVAGSTNNWGTYNPSAKYDIEETLNDTYFWINAHVGLTTDVVLSNKEVTFNNKEVAIDEATVTPVKGIQPTGEITYKYYTDAECKNEMKELPVNAGKYYVVATMAQDENYRAAKSNVATLTINKAVPKLSMLKGSAITYGESINKSTPSGKAEGVVKGGTVEGAFGWTDGSIVPEKAGTALVEVTFTPTGVYATNYTNATGTAKVTVNKADPTVTLGDKTTVFDGRAVEMTGAVVTGIDGNSTGQKVSYDYYSDEECKQKLTEAPTDAGVYYVLAKASSNTNYNYEKMETPAVLTINPRESQLVQVPLGQVTGGNKYRVYVTNTAHVGPEGTINLSLIAAGNPGAAVTGLEIQEDDKGRFYTEFVYKDVSSAIGTATEFKVKAEYSKDGDNNYNVSSNELTMQKNDADKITIMQEVELNYDGVSVVEAITDIDEIKAVSGNNAKATWLNLTQLNTGDVATFEVSGDKNQNLTIVPKNAGNVVAFAYVSDGTNSWYVAYNITVRPVEVSLNLIQSEVYSAQPMWADEATATYKNGSNADVDITDELVITYEYYKDAAMTERVTDPVNAQTYYVKLTTPAQRNYNAGVNEDGTATFTIMPAELTTTIEDKTVVYDGNSHVVDEAVVTGLLGEDTMNEKIRYLYKKQGDSGEASEEAPVDAGIYTVTSTYIPGAKDNYNYKDEESIGTATLTIEQADCTVEYTTDKKVYNAQPVSIDTENFIVTGIEDRVLEGKEKEDALAASTFYYRSLMEAEYTTDVPVDAGIYAVYVQKEAAGNYKKAISKPALLVIEKAELGITVPSKEIVYTGDPVDVNATVTGLYAADTAEVQYLFFEDETEHVLIENPPVNVGTYYVRPIVLEQENYKRAIGDSEKIIIKKAVPILSNMNATELIYGDELEKTTITGIATGVKGEELTGIFEFSEAILHEVRAGGEHVVNITFVPTGDSERNYEEAYTTVVVKVNAIEPTMTGTEKECVYNGQMITLEPVKVTGPEGLAAPEGTVTYEYYADEALTTLIGTDGVKNVGTYYCKVTFASSNLSYTDVSKVYKIEVKKADAAIAMYLDFEKTDSEMNDITIRGALVGVFDDPTGTIDIYKRVSGENNLYELTEAENVPVQEKNGAYIFEADITVKTDEVYDFKAVYKVGTLDNYNIEDGELTDVDMSKDPQHIYFEENTINKVYGDDDFVIQVVDENNGTGKVTYRIVEALNQDKAISVTADGTVKILDTGKAFCIAVKEGDDTHIATVAIVCINVRQAPVELKLEDMVITYSGREVNMHEPEILSNGKAVDEEISLTYSYVHKETGIVMDSLPIEAGEYEVLVSSHECKHYYGSTEDAKALLTIEKAKSTIELKTEKVDKENKQLLLKGILPGVFDDPTGTITLYQKLSSQPETEYKVVGEEITIRQDENGTSYFMVLADVELNEKYDFRAVYVEGAQQNYVITDGELTDVVPKKVVDEQGKDDTQDKEDDKNQQNGSKTGDTAHTMLYVVMMMVSIVTIIKTQKRIRR